MQEVCSSGSNCSSSSSSSSNSSISSSSTTTTTSNSRTSSSSIGMQQQQQQHEQQKQQVALYAEELKRLRADSRLLRARQQQQQQHLFAAAGGDLESVNSRLLAECNATAIQTEDLGLTIMQQLRMQRDSILKTNRLAEATAAEGSLGRQAIVKMIRNHCLNRALLTATILLLAVCILLLLAQKSRLFRFLLS
ncbi:hypothetical protein Efla_004601 [Eimeria flavescens]